jgi:hypothetical protein
VKIKLLVISIYGVERTRSFLNIWLTKFVCRRVQLDVAIVVVDVSSGLYLLVHYTCQSDADVQHSWICLE